MRRRNLLALAGIGLLPACASETVPPGAVLDDGTSLIGVAVSARYEVGAPDVEVWCTLLRGGRPLVLTDLETPLLGGIRMKPVSGHVNVFLLRVPHSTAMRFVIRRDRPVVIDFDVPALEIPRLPGRLVLGEPLMVPSTYVPAADDSVDHYSLYVQESPQMRHTYVATKLKSFMEIDPKPDLRDGALQFKHLIGGYMPSGTYPATLSRLHQYEIERTPDHYSASVAVTTFQNFDIEVKDQG
jgi:hypothetical protein